MKRSAYFTTGFAIKVLANLSRADIVIHNKENIPKGPTIFVINHFTRIETLLIPYYIYSLTEIPVFSLASDSLFKGGLKKFFDMVGVISTKDPKRDKLILKGLLTGSENWIIFPEGRMVKTKQTMGGGKFLIGHPEGMHKPHTGAASLALRAEFFRRQLLLHEGRDPEGVANFLQQFEIDSIDQLRGKATAIVPVNLTYYPIRAKENLASFFAKKVMKEIPERMVEEIMTEGTMLLSGVDLDIHFGKPIAVDDFLRSGIVGKELLRSPGQEPLFSGEMRRHMQKFSVVVMEKYMRAIYDMTTINHEHLFASFLKIYPWKKMCEMTLRRRVYHVSTLIGDAGKVGCNLHKSLQEDQLHLLTDDRYKKVENFVELALEKGILRKENGCLVRTGSKITNLLQYHRGRIDNPIKVMANEVEPLVKLQKLIFSVAWQPDILIKRKIVASLLKKEEERYKRDCSVWGREEYCSGAPYLLRGSTRKIGVVLVHSYLAMPEEVRGLAEYLNGHGLWVYSPRLAGHGTSPLDLASRGYGEWQQSVEGGYAIMSNICARIIVGGFSVGGCLALDLASRVKNLAGVFALCPPLHLKDYSTNFMPVQDVWDRILAKMKRNGLEHDFFDFLSDNPSLNYRKNPILGVREVGSFLEHLQTVLVDITSPALVVHYAGNAVVGGDGSRKIFDRLGSKRKEYTLLDYNLPEGGRERALDRINSCIGDFIRNVGS